MAWIKINEIVEGTTSTRSAWIRKEEISYFSEIENQKIKIILNNGHEVIIKEHYNIFQMGITGLDRMGR